MPIQIQNPVSIYCITTISNHSQDNLDLRTVFYVLYHCPTKCARGKLHLSNVLIRSSHHLNTICTAYVSAVQHCQMMPELKWSSPNPAEILIRARRWIKLDAAAHTLVLHILPYQSWETYQTANMDLKHSSILNL